MKPTTEQTFVVLSPILAASTENINRKEGTGSQLGKEDFFDDDFWEE